MHTICKQNDYIKLTYMNARWYDSSIGRFISGDTIVPDPTNPQSFNRYSYVSNSPINFTDPTGFWECAAGDDQQRCVDWVTDLLERLQNDGGEVSQGVLLWFEEYDQSLIDEGGGGVIFEILDDANFGMKARPGKIQIRRDLFYKAENNHKAALLAHEITHLYQGIGVTFSKMGEIAAYYVQTEILEELNQPYAHADFLEINKIVDSGTSGSPFSAQEINDLEDSLININDDYGWNPRYPLLIGFNGNVSDYDLVVEPIRFFQSLSQQNQSSSNTNNGAQ